MTRGRAGTPFCGWQWAELVAVMVLIWTQVILQLSFHAEIAALLVGLILLGIMIHTATWMIPMAREHSRR